ncbi:14044_t:CDS:1, partial [Entrophospora sp. SA101]
VEEVEEIGVVEVDNVGNNYGDDNNIDGNDDISELESLNIEKNFITSWNNGRIDYSLKPHISKENKLHRITKEWNLKKK